MLRFTMGFVVAASLIACVGCQSPTSSSSTTSVDDYVASSASPDPATASASSGVTYRVVRGNNQPDDILDFKYTTTFTANVTITSNPSDVSLTFPVTVTSVSGKVEQASGGIVTPPTGGDVEHYQSVILSSSGSSFSGTGASIQVTFQVWYSLPSGGRECLVTESVALKDKDGKTFTKDVKVRVAP
jgi:hypothetical protein